MLSRHNISLLRQNKILTEYDPKRGVSVATLAYEYPSSFQVPEHAHGSDQLIYAISGLMRAFRREVGTDFESWRRQVRLTKAVELLVSGSSIKEVAFKIGYCQSRAFVEMFRRTFGTTPKVWISTLETLSQRSTEPQLRLSLAPRRSGKA
jgi:AraC-like DNA-binding protein